MSEFTYQVPDGRDFLVALLALLKSKRENKLLGLVEQATCSISTSGQFSGRRWNAWSTSVYFCVPIDKLKSLTPEGESKLIAYCDQIMPPEAGLDILGVSVSPRLGAVSQQSLEDEISELSSALDKSSSVSLPPDLLAKGREMTEIYLFLYCAENVLRVFIEQVAVAAFGDGFFSQLAISKSVKDALASRKQNEAKKKWMRVRGDSELYYLDFSDLGDLIVNNWELFKEYFPDQGWIKTKLGEMADCRNLIAHNSYVGEHEREVIRLNFKSIVKQIGA